jgi:hypothetical protein
VLLALDFKFLNNFNNNTASVSIKLSLVMLCVGFF